MRRGIVGAMRNWLSAFTLSLTCLAFVGCASAQTAIERRFIPDAELDFPQFAYSDDQSAEIIDNRPWDAFLERYLVAGEDGVNRVRYGAVTADDRATLDNYIAALETLDFAAYSSDEQLGAWINLYNAVTVALILDHYPLKSIRAIKSGPFDFDGPWDDKRVSVAGEALSLNDIEHAIIRAIYDDPRIHYAVNCASIGCPNLRPTAYTGGAIDQALDEQARIYVNHPRGVSIDNKGRVTASKIYAWYREDFGETETNILKHVREFAEPALADALNGADEIRRYEYDWTLNDASETALE